MSMRDEIIQKMYERMAEDLSDTRTKRTWDEASDAYDRDLPDDKADEYRNYLCGMEHAAFFAGANYVLDFISRYWSLLDYNCGSPLCTAVDD